MRLNLFLARAGSGSRREAERWIRDGRVRVNGDDPASPGIRVVPGIDRVTLDGRALALPDAERYAAYHKPRGALVSRRSQGGKRTIFDLLGEAARGLMPVGRLDYDSEGLLLLTTDGVLAEALLHPRSRLVRRYQVWVQPAPDRAALRSLEAGAVVEGVRVRPLRVAPGPAGRGGAALTIDLAEGRKREVRMLARSAGLAVRRLLRLSFGPIRLGDLPPGRLRPLTPREVAALRRAVGAPADG